MAEPEKKIIDKCKRLYETLRETQAKSYAIVDELGALLHGGAGIGEKLKRCEAAWERAWESRYPNGRYVWMFTKDRPQMKRLLGSLDEADLEQRMIAYVRDDDPYLVRARHSFGLFVSQVNRYATAGHASTQDDLLFEPPADCRHTPRCKSEQDHTRQRAADLRA